MEDEVLREVRRMFAPEEGALARARERCTGAIAPPSPDVGSLLRWVARTCAVRAAVEVGSAGGVSGLWLLQGMEPGGVVTSIEPDPHAHGLAADAYTDAGAGNGPRVRAILGEPREVLPRLSDGGYDLVLLQSDPRSYSAGLAHARRLLRPRGVLLARSVLRHGDHAEALAGFLDELATDDDFTGTVLPLDDGLVMSTRRAAEDADTLS